MSRNVALFVKKLIRVAVEVVRCNYTPKVIDICWRERPNRSDLINALISRNGYKSYLEIGCRDDDCFRVVEVDYKVGVDSKSGGTLRMTSDQFFAQNADRFDIVFIDGLHTYEQVRKDFINSAMCLDEGGIIVVHDCLPTRCLAQYEIPVITIWNGSVWKAFVEIRTMPDFDAATCLIDHGVGIIKKRRNTNPLRLKVTNFGKLSYAFLANNYSTLLNTVDYEQALDFAANGCRNEQLGSYLGPSVSGRGG